jgi:hypothetical protein
MAIKNKRRSFSKIFTLKFELGNKKRDHFNLICIMFVNSTVSIWSYQSDYFVLGTGSRELAAALLRLKEPRVGVLVPLWLADTFVVLKVLGNKGIEDFRWFCSSEAAAAWVLVALSLSSECASLLRSLTDAPKLPLWLFAPLGIGLLVFMLLLLVLGLVAAIMSSSLDWLRELLTTGRLE